MKMRLAGVLLRFGILGLLLPFIVCKTSDTRPKAGDVIKEEVKKCPAKCLCSEDRLTLTCRGLRLSDFENISAKFPAVEQLFVKDSTLGNARNDTFKHIGSLQALDLSRCGLSGLDVGSLDHAKGLRELTLSHNKLQIVGEPFSVIDRMFPVGVVHVPNFVSTKNLHKVDLSWNNIRYISKESLYGMKFVRTLNLSNNNLPAVKHTYNLLMGVKVLDMSFNRIKKIDPNFGSMQLVIEALFMSHNYITEMPQFVAFQCENLERVELADNEISSVCKAGVSDCGNLKYLDLEWNKITQIRSGDFEKNAELRILNVGHDLVEIIEDGAFGSCENMEQLHINNNAIGEITEQTLKGLKKMTVFNAAFNRLRNIKERVFSENVWLNYLYLEHNEIMHIHPQAFSRLSLLLIVNLRNNRLSVPYPTWFFTTSGEFFFEAASQQVLQKDQGSLATFHLSDNNWSCDCRSRTFFDWSRNQTLLDSGLLPKIVCATPRFHAGKAMLELNQEEFVCDLLHYFKSIVLFYASAFYVLICVLFCFCYRKICNSKKNSHAL